MFGDMVIGRRFAVPIAATLLVGPLTIPSNNPTHFACLPAKPPGIRKPP
jgi:hypothetical protein